ncbi:MAG: NUDIX hydrolase [Butyrivibrio sp.]|nr:NUDIX hydrolase [Butyrivibrio sp.]
MEYNELPERLERNVIYESDYVSLYADKVRLPNGYIIEKYHQVHYPHEAVSIVVFNENNEVLLIQSKRYTVMRLEWEIPAGRVEAGESKEDAARRECIEETGCTVKDLKFLCSQNPANGMSDCVCHVFAARVDTESMSFDENEVKAKKWVSRDSVLEMLRNNETKDGVAILALLFAFEFYK